MERFDHLFGRFLLFLLLFGSGLRGCGFRSVRLGCTLFRSDRFGAGVGSNGRFFFL